MKKVRVLAKKDPVEARKQIAVIVRGLSDRLKSSAERELQRAYVRGLSDVESELDMPAGFTKNDSLKVSGLLQNPVLTQALAGVRGDVEKRIFETLSTAIHDNKQFSLKEVKEAVADMHAVAEKHVTTIARTETNRFFQAGRRQGYLRAEAEQGKQFLYTWAGPSDPRTTTTCSRIKQRVGTGVPWGQLVQIVTEEAARDFPEFPVDPDAPTSHWQCRHMALRKVI